MKNFVTTSVLLLASLSTFAYSNSSYEDIIFGRLVALSLFWVLIWIIIPMGIVQPIADRRKVSSTPWMVACIFIGWLAPLVLALAYNTTLNEAQRRHEIQKAYKEILKNESEK